ncbi:tyrosine-protein phosphatase [Brevibacterium sp. 50QC2O2]|uniref:tyrosine-protein phosphatase n=1 Tax=Brevibacterium sp. 50QC2O2 TaxID=2968459 RepID=UPI00211BC634|nr:tyrosine-protein phosphatase [Brevibacterium sp. 50QC2O2]
MTIGTSETTKTYIPRVRIPIAGTYNFRDLGGITLADGRLVPSGRVFRSDGLQRLDVAGRAALRRLGVGRIIDLRRPQEVSGQPSAIDPQFQQIIHAPIADDAALDQQTTIRPLAEIYQRMIESCGQRLAHAATAVAESPGPVVFHCTAGKDRTGVLAALILDALGADRHAVIADYASTATNLAGEWTQLTLDYLAHSSGADIGDPVLIEMVTASPAALITATLERVDEEYGGGAEYLRAHGLSPTALQRLRTTLSA